MNRRQKKKKDKRSYLGLTDEMNLIGMTKDERDNVFHEREKFRKKYGYRKKYNSKSKLKLYYISPSDRQRKHMEVYLRTMRTTPIKPTMVIQNYDDIKNTYHEQ